MVDGLRQADPYLDVAPKSIEVKEAADVLGVGVARVLHLPHDHDVAAEEPNLGPHVHTIHLLAHVQVHWFPWARKGDGRR